jgi:hypothetical protein
MWNKDPSKKRSAQSEDRDFREFFGVSLLVVLSCWGMLTTLDLIPPGGTLRHLLWALYFLKSYAKTKTLCSVCSGIDPVTLRREWVWEFIFAIALLEPYVVSFVGNHVIVLLALS